MRCPQRVENWVDKLLYLVAAAETALVLAPLASSLVPAPLRSAFYIMQSIVAVLAVWQAHRYWSAAQKSFAPPAAEAATDPATVGAGDQKTLNRGLRHRTLCL